MRSVCDSGGSARRRKPSAGAVISGLRMAGISSGTAIATTTTAATRVAVGLAPRSQHATSRLAVMAAQYASRIR
jgi:hypothetical protein